MHMYERIHVHMNAYVFDMWLQTQPHVNMSFEQSIHGYNIIMALYVLMHI